MVIQQRIMDKRLSLKSTEGKLKIKEYLAGGTKNSITFKTEINPQDFNQLARAFKDFELQGYPVEKAIKKFKAIKKDSEFPLW